MMIHSSKATKDIEERLPSDLTDEQRDAALRIAIAIRREISVCGPDECVEHLLGILDDLSSFQRARRFEDEARENWQRLTQEAYDSLHRKQSRVAFSAQSGNPESEVEPVDPPSGICEDDSYDYQTPLKYSGHPCQQKPRMI